MQIRLPPFPRLAVLPVVFVVAACIEQSPTAVHSDIDRGSSIVLIEEPPTGPSCTLTQGYWKNHEERWDDVGDGMVFLTTDAFYNSGAGNLTVLATPPKGGNAYLQLAHQFIAASLNLNGALSGVAEVDDAMAGAAAYFSGEAAGIPNPSGDIRNQLQAWASVLDNFNNGGIGPGHCS
ncbi:MAG: hypothetical protein ACT4P6_22365 [Gemmatimonadaceae bacterium]